MDTDDGPDLQADYSLLRRCKRHDYFTSCLPWLQKGDSVQMSLGSEAPIFGDNMDFTGNVSTNRAQIRNSQGSSAALRSLATAGITGHRIYGLGSSEGTGEMKADLTQATAGTINELRQAFQVQRILEKDARSGTRYAEIVQSHFGVTFPDVTYRPVYLGGGSTPVNITPIARTDSSPGVLGAMVTTGFGGHRS